MKQDKQSVYILCLFGLILVIWLGLLMAPAASKGIPGMLAQFSAVMNNPTHIVLCEDSLKTVLVFFCSTA
jgi:type IV secretion system protein VirD4